MKKLKLAILADGPGKYRVELGGVEITPYIANLDMNVETDQIDVSTYGEPVRRTIPGLQRTRVDLALVDIEVVYDKAGAGTTDEMPMRLIPGSFRRIET